MKNTKFSFGKTGCLLLMLLWCFGMTAFAAPSVEGDTQLKAKKDSMVSAQYTITADDTIDSVKLVLSYDKDVLTYMSGSGGDNFSGNGGQINWKVYKNYINKKNAEQEHDPNA